MPRTAAGGHRQQGRCSLAEPCRPSHHWHLSAWEVLVKGFPGGSVVKNPPASSGELGSVPGSGRSPEGRNDNPLQCSCLGNPMDRGAWWATVHGVAESRRWQPLNNHNHQLLLGSILYNSIPEWTRILHYLTRADYMVCILCDTVFWKYNWSLT